MKKIFISVFIIFILGVSFVNAKSKAGILGVGLYTGASDKFDAGFVGNGGITLRFFDLMLGGNIIFNSDDSGNKDIFNIYADYVLLDIDNMFVDSGIIAGYMGVGANLYSELIQNEDNYYVMDFRLLTGLNFWIFPNSPFELFIDLVPKISTKIVDFGSGAKFNLGVDIALGFRVYPF